MGPLVLIQVENIISGIIYFNSTVAGWGQIYNLPETSFATARTTLIKIVDALSWIMASQVQIVGAVLVQQQYPQVRQCVLADPIDSLLKPDMSPYWDTVNTSPEGLRIEQETVDGRFVGRTFRGLADDEQANGRWIREGLTVPPGPLGPPLAPNIATKDELFTYALATIRDKTMYARQLSGASPGNTLWEVSPWDAIYAPKLGKEDVGRKWRPVSWEALDYFGGPAFSPCGMVVDFVRSCYQAPCLFYPDALPAGIRWYRAQPGALAFPLPTVFWPTAEFRQYTNSAGVGEFTGKSLRTWMPGTSWSAAPGVGYTGNESDFLGQTSCPWGMTTPTPVDLLPECDMPAPLPIKIDDDPLTFTNNDVQHITIIGPYAGLVDLGGNHVGIEGIPAPAAYYLPTMLALRSAGG